VCACCVCICLHVCVYACASARMKLARRKVAVKECIPAHEKPSFFALNKRSMQNLPEPLSQHGVQFLPCLN